MSRDIDVISAGISIFDDLDIFVMLKNFLNSKWWDFVTCFLYAVTPLSGLAVNTGNAVDMKVGNDIAI